MNVFRPPFAASNSVGYDSFAYCRSCRDFVPLMALIRLIYPSRGQSPHPGYRLTPSPVENISLRRWRRTCPALTIALPQKVEAAKTRQRIAGVVLHQIKGLRPKPEPSNARSIFPR